MRVASGRKQKQKVLTLKHKCFKNNYTQKKVSKNSGVNVIKEQNQKEQCKCG